MAEKLDNGDRQQMEGQMETVFKVGDCPKHGDCLQDRGYPKDRDSVQCVDSPKRWSVFKVGAALRMDGDCVQDGDFPKMERIFKVGSAFRVRTA